MQIYQPKIVYITAFVAILSFGSFPFCFWFLSLLLFWELFELLTVYWMIAWLTFDYLFSHPNNQKNLCIHVWF